MQAAGQEADGGRRLGPRGQLRGRAVARHAEVPRTRDRTGAPGRVRCPPPGERRGRLREPRAAAAARRERRLPARDAAFATELLAGTCRAPGTYDPVLAAASGRPTTSLQPAVLDVLRLGCHQLLATRVAGARRGGGDGRPDRGHGGRRVTGLVNAVLRRVAEHDLDGWLDGSPPARTSATGWPWRPPTRAGSSTRSPSAAGRRSSSAALHADNVPPQSPWPSGPAWPTSAS